jgi:hypothetical protein
MFYLLPDPSALLFKLLAWHSIQKAFVAERKQAIESRPA